MDKNKHNIELTFTLTTLFGSIWVLLLIKILNISESGIREVSISYSYIHYIIFLCLISTLYLLYYEGLILLGKKQKLENYLFVRGVLFSSWPFVLMIMIIFYA